MPSSRKLLALLCLIVPGIAASGPVIAADDGAGIFAESCGPCHTPSVRPLDNKHMTKDEWKETIDRMIDLGAEVPKKKSELLDYLTRTHGPAGTEKK